MFRCCSLLSFFLHCVPLLFSLVFLFSALRLFKVVLTDRGPRVAGLRALIGTALIADCSPSINQEGIWTNYPMFESTFQLGFKPAAAKPAAGAALPSPASAIAAASDSRDAAAWFTRYGTRRYGKTDPAAVQAWEALGATIYTGSGGGFGSMISCVAQLQLPL
eukprot:SAG22_NODE_101_length_20519_cov_15.588002_1_plen_163_part_00